MAARSGGSRCVRCSSDRERRVPGNGRGSGCRVWAVDLLENVVQPYAWGSRTAIAELRGLPSPSATPEAELWMGAHPGGPSVSVRRSGPGPIDRRPLGARIAANPAEELGPRTRGAFGDELPFLLKVLAAAQPLSLQAHPSLDQARAGFAAEETLGVPRSAPHRNYKDQNHKPELLCALTPFDALCGFRALDETQALLAELGALDDLAERLRGGLREAFAWLMTLDREVTRAKVDATLTACARITSGPFARERAWALRIGHAYPGDVGVIGALLLNLVRLEPGEAIYLPAGNLHAYLEGVGVEIMAASDNVLRGGLTPKHVDVPELLRVLEFQAGPVAKVLPARDGAFESWPTPAREFALGRVTLDGGTWGQPVDAPQIAIVTDGALTLRDATGATELAKGASAWIPASASSVEWSGRGAAYVATVPR
jgi:mannose-6-phosphate isomerase